LFYTYIIKEFELVAVISNTTTSGWVGTLVD